MVGAVTERNVTAFTLDGPAVVAVVLGDDCVATAINHRGCGCWACQAVIAEGFEVTAKALAAWQTYLLTVPLIPGMAFVGVAVSDSAQQVDVIMDDFAGGIGLLFQLAEAVVDKVSDALIGVVDPVLRPMLS